MITLTAYDVLEVSVGAPEAEVKRAYFRLAKRYHPDVCKEPDALERMKHINLAYEAIRDGRGRWWSPPVQQKPTPQARAAPEKPKLEEMIRWANEHMFSVTDDYLIKMEVGGKDKYSRMKLDELEDIVGPIIVTRVKDAIFVKHTSVDRLVGTALRWYLRGLKIELAIRKALADDKFYREEAKKRRYS